MWCGDFVCGVRVDIRTATFGPVHSKRGELRIPTMSALESCQQALARLGCDLSFDELALRPGVERSSIVTYLLERFDACAVQSCFVFWTSSYAVMLTRISHTCRLIRPALLTPLLARLEDATLLSSPNISEEELQARSEQLLGAVMHGMAAWWGLSRTLPVFRVLIGSPKQIHAPCFHTRICGAGEAARRPRVRRHRAGEGGMGVGVRAGDDRWRG